MITITTKAEGTKSFFGPDEMNPDFDELLQRMIRAIDQDRREVQIAQEELDGVLCWDGYDKEGTEGRFSEIERQACEVMTRAVGSKNARGLPHVPQGHPGKDPLLETIAFAQHNMEEANREWVAVSEAVATIGKTAEQRRMESWQGTSGDAYRTRIADRVAEAQTLSALSANLAQAIESLAKLQTSLSTPLYGVLQRAKESMGDEEEFNEAAIRNFFRGKRDQEILGDKFYRRTLAMWRAVAGLAPTVEGLLVSSAEMDWKTPADQLASGLRAAIELARAKRTGGVDTGEARVRTDEVDPDDPGIDSESMKDSWF